MPNYFLADVVVVIHLAFVAFVVLGQVAILLGWPLGWSWTRNPWFRLVHLLSILIVALEGLAGMWCPLTTWERDLRAGNLLDTEGSSWLGAFANRTLFYPVSDVSQVAWFQRGHIAFGLLVLLTFVCYPPRWPTWGSKRPAESR